MMVEIQALGKPVDYELAELLGEKPADFLVLCLDGHPMEGFGTPPDSPAGRLEIQAFANMLNDSVASHWENFFESWAGHIRKQFRLSPQAGPQHFRPEVSWRVNRVVVGYSEYLHCAITLIEKIEPLLDRWGVCKIKEGLYEVHLQTKAKPEAGHGWCGHDLPDLICEAVVWVLKEVAR